MKTIIVGRAAASLLASVAVLSSSSEVRTVAAPSELAPSLAAVFDMDGASIIQDEAHLGIVNGKLALGINYRNVAGISGLWSPPYVSSDFMVDARVGGETIATSNWNWRPFQVLREGAVADVKVTNKTTAIYGPEKCRFGRLSRAVNNRRRRDR